MDISLGKAHPSEQHATPYLSAGSFSLKTSHYSLWALSCLPHEPQRWPGEAVTTRPGLSSIYLLHCFSSSCVHHSHIIASVWTSVRSFPRFVRENSSRVRKQTCAFHQVNARTSIKLMGGIPQLLICIESGNNVGIGWNTTDRLLCVWIEIQCRGMRRDQEANTRIEAVIILWLEGPLGNNILTFDSNEKLWIFNIVFPSISFSSNRKIPEEIQSRT